MRDLGDGGGRRDDEAAGLFPYAEDEKLSGSPTQILQAADDIQDPASHLMVLGSHLKTLHRRVADSTQGVVHTRTAEAPRTATNNLRSVLATTLCAAGTTRLFATDGVRAYNKHVDNLRAEYTSRKLAIMTSECDVPEATYPENATAEEKKKIDDAREARVDSTRDGKVAALVRELRARQEKFKDDPLDAQATTAANRLREGPTDQVMIDLFKAGALPSATVLALPHVKFQYDKLPSDLTDLTPEELEVYVRNHPEARPLVEALLRRGTLTAQELELVKAQARVDAQTLREAVESGDRSAATLDQIARSQQFLRLVNSLTASNKQLSPAAHAYSFAWLDGVGADALSKLSKVVAEAVPHAREIANYLSPVGDAILNLSNGKYQDTVLPENQGTAYAFDLNHDGRIDKEDLPQAIRDLVGMRIGEHHEGFRAGQVTDGIPSMQTVENLDAFNGWVDLLAASNVDGGREFSVDLAEQALQAKQDLNAILVKAGSDTAQFVNENDWNQLKTKLNDTHVSQLLSVVARNEDAASDLLLDESRRQQVLGMNWTDGNGAADLIHAGTDRDPDDGGGTSLQAKAALAVMLEIASDPSEYMRRAANEAVSDAIVDVGITWIDTFGENVVEATDSKVNENDKDILGRSLPFSVTLTDDDQSAFLQFVANTGDDDAIRFEAASQFYGRQLISDALEQDDPNVLIQAVQWAGRADGQIRQANFEWAMDKLDQDHIDKRAQVLAYNRSIAAANVAAKLVLEVGTTYGSAQLPPAALFIAGGKAVADGIINEYLGPKSMPDFESMSEAEAATRLKTLALDSTFRRNYLLAQVALDNNLIDEQQFKEILNGDSLKSLKDIANVTDGANGPDLLGSAARSLEQHWDGRHPGKDFDLDSFDDAWDDTFAPVRDDDDRSNNDSWRNHRVAERNLYGDNVPDWYDGRDPHEDTPKEKYPDQNDQIGRSRFATR